MNSEYIARQLDEIVNKGLESVPIPHQKGNSIRIKHIVVRKSPKGYLIYNAKENRQVVRTEFKSTALAIAKNLAVGKDVVEKVMSLETKMSKHYNDAIFYKNSLKTTTDPFKRDIRETRLDIALAESDRVRDILDRYIFS
jgi:hypothetical protein